jgi:hypothetical protein
MKKLLTLAVFLFPVIGFTAPAPQAADYNIPVHVTHSQLVSLGGNNWVEFSPRLDAVINGKKVELFELKIRSSVLHPGDYKARVVRTGEGKTRMGQESTVVSFEDAITYELLLPDGTTRKFQLIGEEE